MKNVTLHVRGEAKPRTPAQSSELVTIKEMAEVLHCHYMTAREIVLSGALPLVRLPSRRARSGVTRRLLVTRADLERLIHQSRESAG